MISGAEMNDFHLTADVIILAEVFSDPFEFNSVIEIIIKEIEETVKDPSRGEDLKWDLRDLKKLKFYSGFNQYPQKKDLRVVYQLIKNIVVYGFGHRWLPKSIEENGVLLDTSIYEKIKQRAGIR